MDAFASGRSVLNPGTESLRLHRLDRLPALIAAGLLLIALAGSGCSRPAEEAPPRARVEAVKGTTPEPAPERWCDVAYPEENAPRFALPKVVPARPGVPVPALPGDRWVWVNLWATWCGPCLKEMPLLARWKEQLVKEGAKVDLWYLSVDEKEQDLTQFLSRNPGTAPGSSVRLASKDELASWLKKYHLDVEAAAIPIHMLVSPTGKVRCLHVGQVQETDYRMVKGLLR